MQEKISIVTVTFNCKYLIEKTMKSVFVQNYSNIEYIIIDGLSSDGTIELIKRYSNNIDIIVSEPDKGIFDAMNKGLTRATGEWLLFLNAGDQFYNNEVLHTVFNRELENDVSIIHGNVYYFDNNNLIRRKYKKPFYNNNFFFKSMGLSHQSVFVRTNLAKKYKFNLNFKVAADYNLINSIYKEKNNVLYMDIPIAIVESSGFSNMNRDVQKHEEAIISGCHKSLKYKLWNNYNKLKDKIRPYFH